jgi:hypothetical protein
VPRQPLPDVPGSSPGLDLITAGLEIGGSIAAPLKMARAVSELPRVIRLGAQAVGAGVGATAGSVIGNTLVTPPPTRQEFLTRVGAAGTAAAIGEPVGQGVAKVAGKMLAPFASRITETGQQVIEHLKGVVSPSQVVKHHLLSFAENLGKYSIFGGEPFNKLYTKQAQLLEEDATRIIRQFGPRQTREASGEAWQALQGAARQRADEAADVLYADLDRIAEQQGATVSLERLVARAAEEDATTPLMAQALTGKAGQMPAVIARTGTEVIPSNVPGGEEGIRKSLGMPTEGPVGGPAGELLERILTIAKITPEKVQARTLSFTEARRAKSAINAVWADAVRTGNSKLKGVAAQFLETLDEDMAAAAGGADSELGKAWRAADTAWRDLKQTFDEGVLAQVAETEPRLVMDTIIKPYRVKEIVEARDAVGEEAWRHVQVAKAEDLLMENGKLATGEQILGRLHDHSAETLAAVFPRGTDKAFWQLGRVLEQIQRKQPGTASMYIQLAQGSAATAVLMGRGDYATAGAILLGPAAISRILLSPVARRYLTTGLAQGPMGKAATAEGARAASQLLAWLAKEGLVESRGRVGGPPPQPAPDASGRGGGPGPLGSGPPVGGASTGASTSGGPPPARGGGPPAPPPRPTPR